MTLGPIEVVVLGFPGSRFTGEIRPQIMDLVERGIVSVVDALLIKKDQAGAVTFIEMRSRPATRSWRRWRRRCPGSSTCSRTRTWTRSRPTLEPGSSALAMVFEHTWMKPVRDAVAASGGVLLADIHVPAEVVDEVLAAVELV